MILPLLSFRFILIPFFSGGEDEFSEFSELLSVIHATVEFSRVVGELWKQHPDISSALVFETKVLTLWLHIRSEHYSLKPEILTEFYVVVWSIYFPRLALFRWLLSAEVGKVIWKKREQQISQFYVRSKNNFEFHRQKHKKWTQNYVYAQKWNSLQNKIIFTAKVTTQIVTKAHI